MLSKNIDFECVNDKQMKLVAGLIQRASNYRCHITLETAGRRANAKSLLGMMSLGISDRCELIISCDGEDEQEALDDLLAYLQPEA